MRAPDGSRPRAARSARTASIASRVSRGSTTSSRSPWNAHTGSRATRDATVRGRM